MPLGESALKLTEEVLVLVYLARVAGLLTRARRVNTRGRGSSRHDHGGACSLPVSSCVVSSAVCRVVVEGSRACLLVSVECCRVCLTVEIISTTSLRFDHHCSLWSGVTISHGSRADPDGLAVGSDGSSLALAAAICGNCGLMSQRMIIPNQPD